MIRGDGDMLSEGRWSGRDGSQHKIRLRRWILGLFICYLAMVVLLVFYKGWGGITFLRDSYASFEVWRESMAYSLNLIPLRFLFDTDGYTARTWAINVCGNIALFIPMGVFVPVLFPKARAWNGRQFILKAVLLIAGIELAQLLLMCGLGDIDDVILNVSGMSMGFACTRLPSVKEKLSSF